MVIYQNRYIQAAQQLVRLWSGARGQAAGPVFGREDLLAVADQAGVDLDLANQLTADSLELLVSPTGQADPLRQWVVAELLFLSARLAEREGDAGGAREADRRALRLYQRVDAAVTRELGLPDPAERIAALERVGDL